MLGVIIGQTFFSVSRSLLTRKRYDDSVSDYLMEFPVSSDVQLTFDASPFYWALGCPYLNKTQSLRFVPGANAVERVRDILGRDVKVLFLIKDPLLWLTSVWWDGDHIDLEKAKDIIFCMPKALQNWVDVFGRKQILFLDSEKMFTNLSATADDVFDFIGLPQRTSVIPEEYMAGRRRASTVLPASASLSLTKDPRYKECKNELEELSGLTLDWAAAE